MGGWVVVAAGTVSIGGDWISFVAESVVGSGL